jgi:serine/threonine protein kinase
LPVPLREGADFTLYRGRQHGNPSPVLAIALSAEQPSPQSLRRLEHEYSLAAGLDPAWAAKPLALTRHEGRTVLIVQDPGGEPLDQLLERNKGQPLNLTRFLRIAIGLAKSLGQAHREGLIHKDIKPANVLVDNDDNVWLTGFGIASQLPHEHQALTPPEIIAGTLAYMAPEQTGRMNRSIDTRSDLYSLGVTLYQMLTGNLPFAAADAMEWVHCHIARQPTPPDMSANIPAALSAIIMRLLAKTVEERYQTAVGLEADLLLQSYPWPGNIRELQNVIERSVIVCETENFPVDESWLSRQPLATEPTKEVSLFTKLPSQEKAIIEAALSECGGRVYGPFGAAFRLGMPRSTLESKIRSLKIDKDRFKTADPSKYS